MPATRQDLIFEIGADGPFPPQFIWQTDDGTAVNVSDADIVLVIKVENDADNVVMTLSTTSGHITVEDLTKITISVPADEVVSSLTNDLTRTGTVTAGLITRDNEDVVISATGKLAEYTLKITMADDSVSFLTYGLVCFSRL
jgi:hypothetical protein